MRLISSFQPEELGFLRYLRAAKVVLSEMEFSWSKASGKGSILEKKIIFPDRQHPDAAGEPDVEQLLPEQVCEGGLQELHQGIRFPFAQGSHSK